MISIEISYDTPVFNGIEIPEKDYGRIVGYTALARHYELAIPLPRKISLISPKNRKARTGHYQLYPNIYLPEEDLFAQLTFALKYEGVNLLVLKKLFEKTDQAEIEAILSKSKGIYARKIWYLYEWLTEQQIDVEDATKRINYAMLADPKLQFTVTNKEVLQKSERHRITNNLLGTINFCPHVFITDKIKDFQKLELQLENNQFRSQVNKTVLLRASAYLMLKDSQSSFAIEGEKPKTNRLRGWADAIGQAGKNQLTKAELERLQQVVLSSKAKQKIALGYRTQGGFIGDFEKDTHDPRPAHISAKWQDLDALMDGLINAYGKLIKDEVDAVVVATIIAFGFVFIHPFVDGNGRIHRYLVHHILAVKKFTPDGIIFPISASMEKHISKYAKVLEAYSLPLLDHIEWVSTKDKNVEVTNDSIDYYRYFDATHLVEYLYDRIKDTIEVVIPYEIDMLRKFDEFKSTIEEEIGLEDNKIKLLSDLLLRNNGILSNSKLKTLFGNISEEEKLLIESIFKQIHSD